MDSYTIDSVLGIGGMGIVYKANSGSGRTVVVKELLVDADPVHHAENLRRFRREADMLMQLSRPAPFPECYGGSFQDLSREFMAMEFIPGQDLEHVLPAAPNGRIDENEALQIGVQACDGLAVMHNHTDQTGRPHPLIHRDIKPANIILRPSGDICILDVGIARPEKQSGATSVRATRAGTYEYVAPEQVIGSPNTRSDIYSLAATLFHLVTGNAFQGDWDARLTEVDALPPAWQPIFRKAIAKDHNLRQRTVGEFKQDLIGLLPPALRPLPAPAPLQPRPRTPTQSPVFIPVPTVPVRPATTTANVTIVWTASNSFLLPSGTEYRQILAGRVISNGSGVPGANVTVPLISDIGGTGTTMQTQLHGDFAISLADTTVPSSVPRRDLTVVVEDHNTGAELYRETITIARPASVQRMGVSLWNVIATPFRAFGNWRQQRRVNRAPMIQANAQAKAASIAAASQLKIAKLNAQAPLIQAKQAAKLAKAQAKAQAKAAKVNAQAKNPSTGSGWTHFGWVLLALFTLLTIWSGYKGHLYTCALSAYLFFLALRFANKESWKMTWKQVFAPAISFVYLGAWLTLVLTR